MLPAASLKAVRTPCAPRNRVGKEGDRDQPWERDSTADGGRHPLDTTHHARREEKVAHKITATEKSLMKPIRLISVGTLALFLGVLAPAFAQQDQGAKPDQQHEQHAKPAKQHAARPAKQEKQQRTKPATQRQPRPATTQPTHARTQPQHQQQARSQQHGLPPGHQWARSGQKDSRGHEYTPSRFGPDHHAHFQPNGGRFYNGHREFSYGGYWFYADAYPAWFYQQDVYFIMGADGLWYAVDAYDPSLMIQVYIQ